MPLGIQDQLTYVKKWLVPAIYSKYPACYKSIKGLLNQSIAQMTTITTDAVTEVTNQMNDLLTNYGLQCGGVQILGKGDILKTTADKADLIKKMSTGSIFDNVIHRLESILLGNLFVLNAGSNTIARYSNEGTFITSFGDPGSGDGQFNNPSGMRIYPASPDILVIVDTGNNRVQLLSDQGAFLTKWGTFGSGDGQFNQPYGIALNSTNAFTYITDTGNNRVQILYTSSGAYVSQWGSLGTATGKFNSPAGIAIDSTTDNVFVVDRGNYRIQKFNAVGLFERQWTVSDDPIGIDIVAHFVYVTCSGSNLVRVYDTNGRFVKSFSHGFSAPLGVVVGSTNPAYVFISDNSNKVYRFRGDEFVNSFNSGHISMAKAMSLGSGFNSCLDLVNTIKSINVEIGTLDLSGLREVFATFTSLLQTASNVLASVATVLGCGQEMLGEMSKFFPAAGSLNSTVTTAMDSVKKAQETVAKTKTESKYVPNLSPYIIQLSVANILQNEITVYAGGIQLANDTADHPTDPRPNRFSIDYVTGLIYFNLAQAGLQAQMTYKYADLNEVFGTAKKDSVKTLGLDLDLNKQKAQLDALNNFFK
jgi:hypothetical protein